MVKQKINSIFRYISGQGRKKIPRPVFLLRIFAGLLFLILILLLAVLLGTSEKSLRGLTRGFIDSKEVETEYHEHYLEYGFSEDSCRKILEGDKLKHLTADIMAERLLVIFRGRERYTISREEAEDVIREELLSVSREQGLEVDEISITTLVDYTADISGISTMFLYDTPAEYRTAVFDTSKSDIEATSSLLSFLSTISSFWFILLIFLMYMTVLTILYFLDKGDKVLSFLNTSLYPSLAVTGFSIGEIFLPDSSELTDYIFRLLTFSGIIGAGFGVGLYFLIKFLEKGRE